MSYYVSFLCIRCEGKYPDRGANVFVNRKEFRQHLRKEHHVFGFTHKKSGDEKTVLDDHKFAKINEAIRIYSPR